MPTTDGTRHVSINACHKGADVVLTGSDGRVRIVQWTWEQWEQFVLEHGADVTSRAVSLLATLQPLDPSHEVTWSSAGTFLLHAFLPLPAGLMGAHSVCGRAIHALHRVIPSTLPARLCTHCAEIVGPQRLPNARTGWVVA